MKILKVTYKSPTKKSILKNFPPAKLINPIVKITKNDLTFAHINLPLIRKYYPQ